MKKEEKNKAVLVVVDLDNTLVTCSWDFFDDFLREADSNKDKFSKSLCSNKEGLKIPSNYQKFGFAFNDYLIAYLIDLKQRYNNCKVILVTCNLSCKFIKMIVNEINLYYQSFNVKLNNVPKPKQNCCPRFFSSLKRELLIDAFRMTGNTDKRPELQRLCDFYQPDCVYIMDDQLDSHYSGTRKNGPHQIAMGARKMGGDEAYLMKFTVLEYQQNKIVLRPQNDLYWRWVDVDIKNADDFAFKLDFFGGTEESSTSSKSGQAIMNIQRHPEKPYHIRHMTYNCRQIHFVYLVGNTFHFNSWLKDKKREDLACMVDQFDRQYKEKNKIFYKEKLKLPDSLLENREQPLFSSWLKNRVSIVPTEENVNSTTALLKTGCSKYS